MNIGISAVADDCSFLTVVGLRRMTEKDDEMGTKIFDPHR